MIAARRFFLAIARAVGSSGCVWAGWGNYPAASGDGVEAKDAADLFMESTVRTPELEAKVSVGIYEPTTVLLGVVIPLVPIFWPWRSPKPLEIRGELDRDHSVCPVGRRSAAHAL